MNEAAAMNREDWEHEQAERAKRAGLSQSYIKAPWLEKTPRYLNK